jgi:hypothetical protein
LLQLLLVHQLPQLWQFYSRMNIPWNIKEFIYSLASAENTLSLYPHNAFN